MRTLPPDLKAQVDKLGGGEPYAWCFAIVADEDYDTETGTALYVTSYDQPLTFTDLLNGAPGTQSYKPLSATVSSVRVDMSASLPVIQVGVSNVFRDVSKRLETGRGFMGGRVGFVVVNTARLSDGAILAGEGFVRGAVANSQSVTFNVELYGLNSVQVPDATYIVDRCIAEYGDTRCGFRLDLVNAGTHPQFLKCPLTYAGCSERGDYESITLGRVRKHPMRFLGFLGLPRLQRR